MSVRDAASLGSRAVSSAVRPDEARGGRKASSRGRPAREENIWDEESAGSAHLPDHLIGLHGGRSPGPLAEGRSRPTRSRARARECSRGRARAGSSSVEITPAALGSRRRNFSQPGASNRRAVWPCFANIWFALKRERAPRVGALPIVRPRTRRFESRPRERHRAHLGSSLEACLAPTRLKRRRAIARAKHGVSRVFDALDAPRLRSRNAGLHLTPALFLRAFPSSHTRRANVNPANRLPRRWRPRWTPCSRARSATTTRRWLQDGPPDREGPGGVHGVRAETRATSRTSASPSTCTATGSTRATRQTRRMARRPRKRTTCEGASRRSRYCGRYTTYTLRYTLVSGGARYYRTTLFPLLPLLPLLPPFPFGLSLRRGGRALAVLRPSELDHLRRFIEGSSHGGSRKPPPGVSSSPPRARARRAWRPRP